MKQTKLSTKKKLILSDKVKKFDGRNYQGIEIELELGDINGFNNQYIQTKKTKPFPYEFGGRLNKILGGQGETLIRRIERLGLIEPGNSWLRKYNIYPSYQEYFNQEKKSQLMASWQKSFANQKVIKSSLVPKLLGLTNSMNAQVLLEFEDFKLRTFYEYNFPYPEEWVSEFFAQFEFKGDCYISPESAIANLKPERFATTTVAILTIAKSIINAQKLKEISGASANSTVIVHGERLLMGVRYEDYPAVIYNIYALGGAVSKD